MSDKINPKHYAMTFSETITLKENFSGKSYKKNTRRFVTHLITGWFPSMRKDLSPYGVNKNRIINREINLYIEKITDIKTGRIIRNVKEKLKDHK